MEDTVRDSASTCTKRASYFKLFWRSPAVYILAVLGLSGSVSLLHDNLIMLHFLPLGDGPKVHCSYHKSSFGSGPYFIRNSLSAVGLTAGASSYSVWVWMSQSGPENVFKNSSITLCACSKSLSKTYKKEDATANYPKEIPQ